MSLGLGKEVIKGAAAGRGFAYGLVTGVKVTFWIIAIVFLAPSACTALNEGFNEMYEHQEAQIKAREESGYPRDWYPGKPGS